MALTWTNFTRFDEVRNWYENTKPLVSKRFTREQDVRPIGDRSRYYERIVKISDNCYALCDYDTGGRGNYFGAFKHWAPGWEPTPDDIKLMAPIVWERHADGSETVKLRNGSGAWQHNMRYAFLKRHTPMSMSFRQTLVGMQFIRVLGDKEYYLPKHNSLPAAVHAGLSTKISANPPSHYNALHRRLVSGCDGKYLMFRKNTPTSGWTHIHGEFEPKRPSAPLVDKETKAAFKQGIAEFYQWAVAIMPMLGTHRDYQAEQAEREVAREYLKSLGAKDYSIRWYIFAQISLPAEHVRTVLTDPEHPLRMFALRHLFCNTDDIRKIETVEDAKRFKSQYNRWVNKFFGFTKRKGDDK